MLENQDLVELTSDRFVAHYFKVYSLVLISTA